jgi:type IV secretory pathway VirB3-like protein
MSEKEVKIHKDLLFVALTRVPTIAGVPYMAFVLEMMFASMMIIMLGTLAKQSLLIKQS